MTEPDKRPPIDWEAVEREYRAGQLSIREIGASQGVSHVAIMKRAKRDGWERNLSEAVREKVTTRLVTDGVTDGVTSKSNRETVELAAERVVQIVREHRTLIGRAKRLIAALFDELEEATESRDEIEATIEDETRDDTTRDRRNRMLRAVALPARASTLLSLANASKAFIGLDRQAFGLTDDGDGRAPEAPRVIEWTIVDP